MRIILKFHVKYITIYWLDKSHFKSYSSVKTSVPVTVVMEIYFLLNCNFLISAKDGIDKQKKQFQGNMEFRSHGLDFVDVFILSTKFMCSEMKTTEEISWLKSSYFGLVIKNSSNLQICIKVTLKWSTKQEKCNVRMSILHSCSRM